MSEMSLYKFGKGITDMTSSTGSSADRIAILGGKGAKLAEMGALGLPVPPGITISTYYCMNYLNATSSMTQAAIMENLVDVTLYNYKDIKKELGYMPLVSVRSGARVSMPGMMDTILNVGINDSNLNEWADRLGSLEAAEDCYRRLIEMYGEVVIGIPSIAFTPKEVYSVSSGCAAHISAYKTYEELTGVVFPQTIEEQLAGSIGAVFKSWFSDRARAYRQIHGYPDDWGTAVNIQQMVFGNRNDRSASGTFFTRDFNTGEHAVVGDWLVKAQGEDVVAGTHDTHPLKDMWFWQDDVAIEEKAYELLLQYGEQLENHYKDMQDIEWTIDDGELFILQTRDGKRSARSAFKIAYDLYDEGCIDKATALTRVTGKQYLALINPMIDPEFDLVHHIEGIPAAGNVVSGIAVVTAKDAINCTEPCILVTKETTPNDFAGMAASVGILTQTGGITSHAAVVARGMDKTCVVGAENFKIGGTWFGSTPVINSGDHVTIDGLTGRVWIDVEVPVIDGQIEDHVHEMIDWALEGDTSFLTVEPESIPESGMVYVDASGYLQTQKSLIEALKRSKASGATGVIGFGKTEIVPEADSGFLGYFGVETQNHDFHTTLLLGKTLSLKIWTKKMKMAWTVHLPAGVSADFVQSVRDSGWKTVTLVNSFKTALTVDGFVQMDEKFLSQLVRENMEFSDIEELVVKAGREVRELPVRVSKSRLLFDVLGG